MRKKFLLLLLFVVFVVSGAMAGSDSLVGDWDGEARAILPDGTIIESIDLGGTINVLDGGLFAGDFEFTLPGSPTTTAFATGYIKAQKIEGIMSVPSELSPTGVQGIGLFSAKLKGKKMEGVVRDLSDGSTTYFTAERID
jgi:hypothetical protein